MLKSFKKLTKDLFKEDFVNFKLGIKWREIVGPFLSKNCSPAFIKDGTLYIYASSSSWMHHLSLLKGDIQDNVYKSTGLKLKAVKIFLRKKERVGKILPDDFKYLEERIKVPMRERPPREIKDRIERLKEIGSERKKKFSFSIKGDH